MKIISRRVHAMLDYLAGIVLIVAPWLLGFSDVGPAKWSAIIIGILIIGMSMMTRYEGGVMKAIPMSTHLLMDVVAGLFLAASPWILGFASAVFLPHLILGLFEIFAGMCTQSVSQPIRTQGHFNPM